MKSFLVPLFALLVGLAAPMDDAWAKRLGGGTSSGMQRSAPATAPSAPQAAPAARPGQTAPAATPGKRSWLGPLAGIAGAIGLAALLSHLGLGEDVAGFLMMALLAVVAFMAVRWFMNRNRKPAQRPAFAAAAPFSQPPPAPAPVQAFQGGRPDPAPNFGAAVGGGSAGGFAAAPASVKLPADIDAAGFVRQAKLNFVRLQAANDAGDLNDIREFTTPEMYAEIKLQLDERGGGVQHTEVVELNADILDYAEENGRQILSVRFHGLLREEEGAEAAAFEEAWHLARPADRSRHWLIAGIQQLA